MGSHILIVRLGSLGDVMLTSPTALNLKINYPDSHICFLTRERFTPVVELFEGVDEVISVPDKIRFRDMIGRLHHLDQRNFDLVVDLHGNFRSWLTRRMVVGKRSLVYPKRRLERRLIAKQHRIPETWPHTIDLYNDVLTQMDQTPYCKRPTIRHETVSAEPSQPTVLIAPGAAHETKRWPLERFVETARRLINESGARIIWLALSSEMPPSSVPDLAHCEIRLDCSLEETLSLAASADLILANDSGIAHLGSAVGVPVLALFGPTHPALGFAPRGLRDEIIQVDEPCRPCSVHGSKPCFREERFCFTRISFDSVVKKCQAKLDEGRGEKAVLIDRDGTLIANRHYLSDPEGVELEENVPSALRLLKSAGFRLIAVSNQSGVARGLFGVDQVDAVNRRMLELLEAERIELDAVYYCPHHATDGIDPLYSIDCNCRKPHPGMAEQAALELGLDLRRSYVVGDSLADLDMARVIGATPALVRTGYGQETEVTIQSSTAFDQLIIGDTLQEVVDMILTAENNE